MNSTVCFICFLWDVPLSPTSNHPSNTGRRKEASTETCRHTHTLFERQSQRARWGNDYHITKPPGENTHTPDFWLGLQHFQLKVIESSQNCVTLVLIVWVTDACSVCVPAVDASCEPNDPLWYSDEAASYSKSIQYGSLPLTNKPTYSKHTCCLSS